MTDQPPGGSRDLPDADDFVVSMGGDRRLCLDILVTACGDVRELVNETLKAAASGERAKVGQMLHALRGSTATLGATRYPRILKTLEDDLDGPYPFDVGGFHNASQAMLVELEELRSCLEQTSR